jgi:hypothetical protein
MRKEISRRYIASRHFMSSFWEVIPEANLCEKCYISMGPILRDFGAIVI